MTAPNENRVATQCEQCGIVDIAPKAHLGTVTKHNDCLSFAEEQQIRASSEKAATIIDACKAGKRNHELLTFIRDLHTEDGN